MLNSQEEIELKDMQDYLALVSLMGAFALLWLNLYFCAFSFVFFETFLLFSSCTSSSRG